MLSSLPCFYAFLLICYPYILFNVFYSCITCLSASLVAFCGALISKDATVASVHTTVQVTWLVMIPFGCDQKQFLFITYLIHEVYCIHCGYHCKRKVPVKCLYHYSLEHMVVYSLATAKRVHTSGGEAVEFIYLIKGTRSICFNRTELNTPLPPFVGSCAPHQECMCKTGWPPCQLMRPRRLKNRVETDTYCSLYWLVYEHCGQHIA